LSKNRCTLKSKNPLVADENHVARQRATAKKTGSSFRRYASRLFVLGTGSLIKSGIQQMVIPKRLDSIMLNMRPVLDVSTHPVDDEAVDTPLERGLKSSSGLFKISDPYLACLLSPSLYSMNGLTKSEEQILALERRTCSPRRTENRSTVNRFLLLFRTPNPGSSKAQILNRSASG